jgi:hypothetical protein
MRRCCCCCFWWILDRLLRTDCESLVALLVDARRCILCHVVNEAGCGCAPNGAAEDGEADCLVEKLSLLATVEGVAGYGIELELGLAFLDDATALAAALKVLDVLTDADDVDARRPDRLQGFLGTTPALLEDPAESSLAAPAFSSGPKGDDASNGASFPQGEGAAPTASSTLAGPFFLERLVLTTGVESPPLDSSELLLLLCPFPRGAGRLKGVAAAGDAAAFLGLVPSDAAAFLGLVPSEPLFDRRVPRWLGVLVSRDFIEGEAPLSSCNDRDDDPRA